MSIVSVNPEPVVRAVEAFTCPVCGETFLERSLFDAHAVGCSIGDVVGRFVRFRFEGEVCVGRIIDTYPGEREYDEYDNLVRIEPPVVAVVFPVLNDRDGYWIHEEELDPWELEEVDRRCLESEVRRIAASIADHILEEVLSAGGEFE